MRKHCDCASNLEYLFGGCFLHCGGSSREARSSAAALIARVTNKCSLVCLHLYRHAQPREPPSACPMPPSFLEVRLDAKESALVTLKYGLQVGKTHRHRMPMARSHPHHLRKKSQGFLFVKSDRDADVTMLLFNDQGLGMFLVLAPDKCHILSSGAEAFFVPSRRDFRAMRAGASRTT